MKHTAHRLSQLGLTLIELMVSMVMGLLIVLALTTMLINVNRNNSELGKTNRLIENGRFALQLLQADVMHAGYWGGMVPKFDDLSITGIPTDVPTAVPDPCLAYSPSNWTADYKANLLGIPVQAYELPAVVPSPALSVCATKIPNPKGNTDVLFVRHAENCVPGEANCAATTTGELYLQIARCGNALPSQPYMLDTTGLTLQKRDCTSTAELRRFTSNLYYIRDYAVTQGDGIPTLMRSQFGLAGGTLEHKEAVALIEGIEGFRVEMGIDNVSDSGEAVNFGAAVNWANPASLTSPRNRGDGIPDGAYLHCSTGAPCSAAQLMNVVAVRLYVLVRNEKPTSGYTDTKTYTLGGATLGPFNDGYKRHLFIQTVRLTNISSRRETP